MFVVKFEFDQWCPEASFTLDKMKIFIHPLLHYKTARTQAKTKRYQMYKFNERHWSGWLL